MLDLYNNASLILTANAYSQSKVIAMKPTGSTSGDFFFSRNSIAYRKTSTGIIQAVNSNIPRLTYLPQVEYPGFLLEPSRTNLFSQSNGFYGPEYSWPWLSVNITLTSSQAISPDGTLNGWKLSEIQDIKPSDTVTIINNFQTLVSANGGIIDSSNCISSSISRILGITTNVTFNLRHYNTYVPNTYVSVLSGSRYICSAYVKPAGREGVAIQSNLNGLGYLYTKFNLTDTGSVYETPTGYTASITQEANGWYRISTAATANTSSAKYFSIDLVSGSSYSTEYLGSADTGIYLYGTQVEAATLTTSTTASSYIPTTNPATRASDLMSGSGLITFTNTSNPKVWTIFIDYNAHYEGTNANGGSFLYLRNESEITCWYLSKTSTGIRCYDFINTSEIFELTDVPDASKIVLASDGYTISAYVNGQFAAFYTPANTNMLSIRRFIVDPTDILGSNNNPLTSVLIKNIIIYPDALAAAGCTYLTSLNT